jgi:hypothetical protein
MLSAGIQLTIATRHEVRRNNQPVFGPTGNIYG